MNPPLRLALCAVLLCAGVWTGCSSTDPGEPPGRTEDTPGLPDTCQVDRDCPDPGLFFCDTATSRCQAACRTQADCTAAKRGSYQLAECEGPALGCRCDANRCVVAQCSADTECAAAGQVCRDGACAQAPATSRVAGCQVTPDFVVGRVGRSVRFSVLAVDAAGAPVVVPAGVAWTALEPSVRSERSEGGESSFVLSAPTDEARELVRAHVGTATCTAKVRVLGAVGAGELRAVVTDALTGRPLEAAWVVTADAQGTVTGSARTDAGGVATLPAPSAVGSLSVFHEDFDYLTLAHEGPDGPRELTLPLRRNPSDRYGGTQGAFLNLSMSPDLHTGLSGLSTPDAVWDVTGTSGMGAPREVDFVTGGQARQATLPASAYVVFPGSTLDVRDASARGLAGVCDVAPEGTPSAEEAMRLGACGTRTAWALGGDIPLNALAVLSGGGVDVGQVLAQTLPQLRTFRSSVVRDARFGLRPTPGVGTGAPDVSDVTRFTRVDHDFQAGSSLPLGFQFALRVPALPRSRGTWMDSVAVLGGVRVPGRGLVPLGLGAGTNTSPVDPNTDTQAGLPGPGLVSVRMAPAHHGLEGQPYELVLTASQSATSAAAGAGSSLLVHRALRTLPFDPRGSTPVAPLGPFLSVPEGSRYNYASKDALGLKGRQWRFPVAPELPPSTLLRAVFTTRSEHHWNVFMDVARAASGLRLPVPPASLEDRTYWGDLPASRAPYAVQALALRQGGTPDGAVLGLRGLVEAQGVDLGGVGAAVVASSSLDYGRAAVEWVVPAAEGQSVARGSRVKVRVSFFRVGSSTTGSDDGAVRLTFSGGTGCEGETVTGTETDSQGLGEVELLLPSNCSGTRVQLTAALVDPSGTPLVPAVASTRAVVIPP